MYQIIMQRQSDFVSKERYVDTYDEAVALCEAAIARANQVLEDEKFDDVAPLKRSLKLRSETDTYVMNMYKLA